MSEKPVRVVKSADHKEYAASCMPFLPKAIYPYLLTTCQRGTYSGRCHLHWSHYMQLIASAVWHILKSLFITNYSQNAHRVYLLMLQTEN